MFLRKALGLGVAAFLCLAGAAHAQVGVYGMYEGTDTTNVTCLALQATPPQQCSSPNGTVKPFGGVVGVYYNWKTFGPVRFGFDARSEFLHAGKSAADSTGDRGATRLHSALGGVRGTFRTPIKWMMPYAQISAGWASSNVSEASCVTTGGTTLNCGGVLVNPAPLKFNNFVKYEGFAGVDIRVFPIVDLRLVELGIGGMERMGTGNGNSSLGVKSIGAGLVFHLP
ncbi:MAG: hypothetical protein ABI142_02915 [Bryocella sp.]